MTTLVHTWTRKFSQHRVMTVTRTLSDLMSEYKGYQQNITRPLFVILLDTEQTMIEFSVTTKTIKPISFPFWLVIFLQHLGNNPLEEYCRHPTDNVFNVDFGTQMLVLCYDRPNLVEWYAIRDNRTRTFDLATWTPDKGLILKTLENVYARRSDMFGDVIRVGSVTTSPLVTHKNDGTLGGYLGTLLTQLSKEMNFTVKFLNPVEAFGWLNEEGTAWTGVIGQLMADEVDLGVSAFTRTTRRQNVVDFTIPLTRSHYRLYYKEVKINEVNWSTYFRAFSFEVWISLVIIIVIATIMLTIMKAKEFSINLIFENYIKVWGIYCQQSLPGFPKDSPMRLAFLSIYASSIVTLSMYSASAISYITLSTTHKSLFTTLEGFVKDGSYKFLVLLNSAEYDLPSRTKDPVFIKLYTLKDDRKNLPATLYEGFEQICRRPNVAFYTTILNTASLDLNLKCTIGYIGSGRIDNMGLMLQKGSPYTRFINYQLRRFNLNGVMNKLKNEYMSPNVPFSGTVFENVSLVDVTPILTIVLGSMILALFILIFEKIYNSFKTRLEKKLFRDIKKFNNTVNIRNKLQKRNSDLNPILKKFDYSRPFGYLP
ncbi:glutamate receptor ionotropic, delta-2-like [Solenopsis invicta]|uniref:glutamate receptor ionotropic, delta-2-like n=1 Tax=Solenopsis invicta TaxID=13686 RepID=UPI00193EAF2D|nr:glutamate receptor ionotropic, delta-2-like [Solenopsis invicta]